MAGLTPTGFVPETFETLVTDIETTLRDTFGDSIDLSAEEPLGQFVQIVSDKLAELWELAEAINASQDPDAATGTNLEGLAALTGTTRLPASPSLTVLTLTGVPATAVPSGSQGSTASTLVNFETTAAGLIALLASWGAATAYALGDRVTNGGDAWVCTLAGVSLVLGPDSTGLSPGDTDTDGGGVEWRYMGLGTGAIDVAAQAVDTGPTVALAFDINTIETPVAGWDGVLNLEDADLGRNIESDAALRLRRELELASSGTSTLDAIRAALLDVAGVTTVPAVFHNTTDFISVDGIPPHAVEALVQGGLDQDIFDALLANVAAGIATHGTSVGSSDDSAGIPHVMKFTRPADIDIYVDVTLTYDADLYPADGDDQVEDAIINGVYAGIAGRDVVASAVAAACFAVPGVLDATPVLIDIAPAPATSATIPIDLRELADYDTSRITVTSSAATP